MLQSLRLIYPFSPRFFRVFYPLALLFALSNAKPTAKPIAQGWMKAGAGRGPRKGAQAKGGRGFAREPLGGAVVGQQQRQFAVPCGPNTLLSVAS